MKISININDDFVTVANEISISCGMKNLESFIESEILSIIKENLESYGYNENGNKIESTEYEEPIWIFDDRYVQEPSNIF